MTQFKSGLAALLAATAMISAPAMADTVVLSDGDGGIQIRGKLIGFEDGTYTIDTAIGRLTLAAANISCEGDACPDLTPQGYRVAGSRAITDFLLPNILTSYTAQYGGGQMINTDIVNSAFAVGEGLTEPNVFVEGTDTSTGLGKLYAGEADLAMASRPARNREVRMFDEAGKGALRTFEQEHVIALDALVIATHPENPVRAISELNAALVFGGAISNWREIGGREAPINLYVREDGSGTREIFDNLLMRPNGLTVAGGGNVTVLPDDEKVAEAVAQDPFGIGFTSFAQLGDASGLAIEGVCGLRTPPTAHTIQTEEYPLTRLLYAYQANGQLPNSAQMLLDFVETEAGQTAIAEAGFINQQVDEIPLNSQGLRIASAVVTNDDPFEFASMREMVGLLMNADRLTTTFRFETGSSRLTARSEADLGRLADLMERDAFANKEVIFVGFTDSVGKADLNQQLSAQRADEVRRTLLQRFPDLRGRARTRAIGYGEISPLGCNETDNGRRINRRVEVWVQDIATKGRL